MNYADTDKLRIQVDKNLYSTYSVGPQQLTRNQKVLNGTLLTPYIKTIHFLGAAGVGFFIAATIFTFKFEGNVDWINSITGITLCLFFAFFPGAAKKQSLTIDETGIYLHNYTFHWGQKKEITWEKIRGVGVQNNVIEIKNSVGSTEKINLPLHTKSQLEELRSYLKQMTEIKGLEYIK